MKPPRHQASAPGTLAQLEREGIKYVVAPVDRPLRAEFLKTVYEDEAYRLYELPARAK